MTLRKISKRGNVLVDNPVALTIGIIAILSILIWVYRADISNILDNIIPDLGPSKNLPGDGEIVPDGETNLCPGQILVGIIQEEGEYRYLKLCNEISEEGCGQLTLSKLYIYATNEIFVDEWFDSPVGDLIDDEIFLEVENAVGRDTGLSEEVEEEVLNNLNGAFLIGGRITSICRDGVYVESVETSPEIPEPDVSGGTGVPPEEAYGIHY